MSKGNSIFNYSWEFYISRNLPVWHSTLQLTKSNSANRHYKLNKKYFELRIHRNLESDFYYTLTGRRPMEVFVSRLKKKLEKKEYINFLKKEYKKDCSKFLAWSKRLRPTSRSLRTFLNFYGYCTALLDITSRSSKILTDQLMIELKDNIDREAIINYYSTPKQLAPFQRLEKAVDKFHAYKDLDKAAEVLWKRYHWIPVSFVGEPWNKQYFLNLLKTHIKRVVATPQKPKVKLSTKLRFILSSLSKITYLNEYRKGIFCQVSLNIRPVLNNIAKISGLKDWKEICLLTHDELILAAAGKNFSKLVARRKKKVFAVHNIESDKFQLIDGLSVKKFENKFKIKNTGIKEFKGVIGNKGKVTGKVRIVLNHADFSKLKSGEVLVAKMTSVDYLSIMKKASAFITDEGGLACHAAVVSREFGVPCIIGTKIATSVLKDGDNIEVDADNGVIKLV